jgi:adenosylhomocysteine nucleosidase
MTTASPRLGIISALHQEQAGLIEAMEMPQTARVGMRDYVEGSLWGTDCVCVLSRIGKVAAAATAATLIERFNVTQIVFTGVAGAADANVMVGDIVIAENLIQYDLNAEPLFPRFEIPLLGFSTLSSHKQMTDRLIQAATGFLDDDFKHVIETTDREFLNLNKPHVHHGLIGSGDQFIYQKSKLVELKALIPDLLAVEMEGAAVAQVCFEFGLPFAIIRSISDGANENSAMDFVHFIERVAARYTFHIVKRLCQQNEEVN